MDRTVLGVPGAPFSPAAPRQGRKRPPRSAAAGAAAGRCPSRPPVRPCSPPGFWLMAGALVLLGGVVMAALGYWHRDGAAGDRGAPARPTFSGNRAQKLRVLGPVTMGVGIFILICANAVLQENRGERRGDGAEKAAAAAAAAATRREGDHADPVEDAHRRRFRLLRLGYPGRGRRASTVGPSPEPGPAGREPALAQPGSGPPTSRRRSDLQSLVEPLLTGPVGPPAVGIELEFPACTAVSVERGTCRDGESADVEEKVEEEEDAPCHGEEDTQAIARSGEAPLTTAPELGSPSDLTDQDDAHHHHHHQQMVTLDGRSGSRGRDDFWLVL